MQAIVVTFDRLATRLLGCYGNEWVETPHFDRLASMATVFDEHFVDTVGPRTGQAWLTGQHALRAPSAPGQFSIGQMLRAAGVSTQFITVNGTADRGWHGAGFDQSHCVTASDGLNASPAEVPFARLVQAGAAALKDDPHRDDRRLLWLHAPEPGLPPEGFATLYFEDFEERGFQLSAIERDDWERQLAVAAGSVSLVDHWLGVLIEEIKTAAADRPTLILITAAGGRAWMDDFHAASPSVKRDSPADKLRDQQTRAPLIVAVLNDDRLARLSSIRCRHFVQPTDFVPTLLDWFNPTVTAKQIRQQSLLQIPLIESSDRQAIFFGDEDRCFGIRTNRWGCLTRVRDPRMPMTLGESSHELDGIEQVQLFAKPDDVWDVTDLSTQYPSICQQLLMDLEALRRQPDDGVPGSK